MSTSNITKETEECPREKGYESTKNKRNHDTKSSVVDISQSLSNTTYQNRTTLTLKEENYDSKYKSTKKYCKQNLVTSYWVEI